MKKFLVARFWALMATGLLVWCFIATSRAADSVWYDDALPTGAATAVNGGDAWTWITASPAPYSGSKAHQSRIVAGLHEHYFSAATAAMAVHTGDTLYVYVYLDPANVPSEIMVHWYSGSWEHRAYWGSNLITYGANNSAGRHPMGALPAAGQWVRLEVPASALGLEGMTVNGMAFSLYNGRASWDQTGTAAPAPTVSVAATTASATLDGVQPAVLTFTRTGSTTAPLAVNFDLGGTAAKWTDYYRLPQGDMPVSVTIPAGSASTTLTITGRANSTGANPETVIFKLDPSSTYTIGTAAAATITLGSATPVTPTASVVATTATASIDGLQTALLTFSRTGSTTAAMTVNFNLGGTAAKWTDYYRLPQGDMPAAVTIPAGSTAVTLPITARGNSTNANPENATFTLAAGTGYAIGTANVATVNIVATGTSGAGLIASIGSGGSSSGSGTSSSGSTGSNGSTGSSGSTGSTGSVVGNPVANTTPDRNSAAMLDNLDQTSLTLPSVGDHALRVLSPTWLEVRRINTKAVDPAVVSTWNFVNSNQVFTAPPASAFKVMVGGNAVSVMSIGFRRRVLSAPLNPPDLRIDNCLYLQLSTPVTEGQAVVVTNPDGSLWAATEQYSATASVTRYSPAIHVNQEGYVPSFPKKAMIGYYLGDKGELPIIASTFNVVDASTGTVVYTGNLTSRQDIGYQTNPTPYQQICVADFSGLTTPGEYELQVAGIGSSLPFLVNDGIAMGFARTYALGMYEQRCGAAPALPYTRFVHDACHVSPAQVPANDADSQFFFTWQTVAGYASTANANNPAQAAPLLTSAAKQLYPFVNQGTVDVSGGHHDAGDYSKYTENSAELTHYLIFSADSIKGVSSLDNLGIAESGDGIPDVLQEAKWEADFLAKLQDADGGFYFLVYPKNREYESNVLPDDGDPQVVWPKSTSVTAASVAALAEAGSSPLMKKYYPAAAAAYLQKATLGWSFLQNAIAKYGKAGAYQKITFYSDDWTHDDELAWAAAALYVATGNSQYQTQLFSWFPDPSDSSTFRWGWWRMSEGWGNAIRDYAFAARSGRLTAAQLDAGYLAKCEAQVVAAGDDAVTWAADNAYASPFPPATKAVQGGGWYFSLDQASDMAVAYQINPKAAYVDGLVGAMNYEGGTNPVNVTFLTGLGLKRQREIVSQYAENDRRVLPPTGIPLGQVTAGFEYLSAYGAELSELSYPTDNGSSNSYPYYDRWSDAYNVTQEYICVNQARSFMGTAFLAGLTSSSGGNWTAPAAAIAVPTGVAQLNTPVSFTVTVAGQSLTGARIVWEARDQQPAFGATYTISPVNAGPQWIECEVEWPDGRRAFAANTFTANSSVVNWVSGAMPAGAVSETGGGDAWTWVTSNPAPAIASLAHQSNQASGIHYHGFNWATSTMTVGTGDSLFAWVYLDPAHLPSEIMLAWNDGSPEHRAYWGGNTVAWGTDNTSGRVHVGPLPAGGGWVRLTVPASAVNLVGSTVMGMDFVFVDGHGTWDTAGKAAAGY